MVKSDYMFKFEFSSNKAKYNNMNFTVYSYTRQNMELFLRQHNFDTSIIHVDCIKASEFDDSDENILNEYLFKSNKYIDEIYTIITTEKFVSDAIQSICSDLSESLIFGYAAIRTDIEIVEKINDLILSLRHVFVLDHTILGDDSTALSDSSCMSEVNNKLFNKYTKSFNNLSSDVDSYDDSYIYDSMFGNSIRSKPQPITVEAYVSYFASIMLDEY